MLVPKGVGAVVPNVAPASAAVFVAVLIAPNGLGDADVIPNELEPKDVCEVVREPPKGSFALAEPKGLFCWPLAG